MRFNPKMLISKQFDSEFDKNRRVWDDADEKKMEITSAVITTDHMIIFTKVNGYRVGKNKQGKFG